MSLIEQAKMNLNRLANNTYPGRGIVLGMSPDGQHLLQVYWIMGRSTNSRNRIFVAEGADVKTQAFDEAKLEDPSLIIYYPARMYKNFHIITNGDQTDTIVAHLEEGNSFESALQTRCFEPDKPNFTPRISGIMDLNNQNQQYQLAILKSTAGDPQVCQRQFFNYQRALPGIGHCLHTYEGDGDPLPSFNGEPYVVPLFNTIEATGAEYWNRLNPENKISLLVKFIDLKQGTTTMKLYNKHLGD